MGDSPRSQRVVHLSTHGTTIADVIDVARFDARIEITPDAMEAMAHSRAQVEQLAASQTPTYGISTGFGALATRHIPVEQRVQLQRSLVRSHAAGMAAP